MKIKWFCLVLVLGLLGGCHQKSGSLDDYLLDTALPLAQKIHKLAEREGFAALYTSSTSIEETIRNVAEATGKDVKAAVLLTLDADGVETLLGLMGMEDDLTDLVKEQIGAKLLFAIPQQITARSGSEILAASAILTVTESRMAHDELEENMLLILSYGGGYGIWVSFVPSYEKTVMLSASFVIMPEAYEEALLDGDIGELLPEKPVNIRLLELGA